MRIVDRVETTGYITLSLRDIEKVNVRIMGTTELNIMKNPVILSIKS
jgi:predicted aspartyl protease